MKLYAILLVAVAAIAPSWSRVVQQQDYTTPTPILKQINRHNEDGSYSYGYEGADGTYKIETKYPNGEVYGKYGYVDDQGKVREVEYGATRRGFEPAGSEISVPPPTLEQNPKAAKPLGPNEEDDGQYREDPSVYYKDDKYNHDPPLKQYNSWNQQPALKQPSRLDDFDNFIFNNPTTTPRPYYPPQRSYDPQPAYNPRPQPAYNPPPQPAYNPPPQAAYNPPPQPAYNPPPQPAYNPQPYNPPPVPYNPPQPAYTPNYNNYNNYPQNPYVPNIDYYTGSYTLNYR